MRAVLAVILILFAYPAHAQVGRGGVTADHFVVPESKRSDITNNDQGYSSTSGRSIRTSSINTSERTLVLVLDGQSNMTSVGPTSYTQTNAAKIDNFNVYDGATYNTADPVLGSTYDSNLGVGSIGPRLADLMIANGRFDRVILVPIAIGGTSVAIHAAGGVLYERPCVAMRRLASRGIVPGTTGVTFAYVWGQGESDHGTAQATYQASFGQVANKLKNCSGISSQFNGRIFVNKQTLLANAVDTTIQAAQAALVDNVTIFARRGYRQPDGWH